jgi:tetratricopeptide (TPR) repeat protein
MTVELVARSGEDKVRTTVTLTGSKKKFRLTAPFAAEQVLVDPDYRLLVGRPAAAGMDPRQVIEATFKVVNSPKQDDKNLLTKTITTLGELLAADPGDYEGLCHTGIGRCRFRLGEFKAARSAFEEALRLGAGGPFHRAWIYLRLGNMADVERDRKAALAHYQRAVNQGRRYHAAKRAAGYLKQPYKGYTVEK